METIKTEVFDKYMFKTEKFNTGRYAVKVLNLNAKKEYNKTIKYYGFKNLESAQAYITKFKIDAQKRIDYMNERKAQRQAVTASPELVGKLFYDSWGYDMTFNDYIKIIGVKNKTVEAVRIARKVTNDEGRGAGRSIPCPDKVISEPFRLAVRGGYDGGVSLVGQYPYCNDSKRKGYFSECKPTESHYYNTWD